MQKHFITRNNTSYHTNLIQSHTCTDLITADDNMIESVEEVVEQVPTDLDVQPRLCEYKSQDLMKRYNALSSSYNRFNRLYLNLRKRHKAAMKKFSKIEVSKAPVKSKSFRNQDQMYVLTRKTTRGIKWSKQTVKNVLQINFTWGTTGYKMF